MAFEIPSYLDPILEFYNIPWPDIDEDAFLNLQAPLRAFGRDLDAVGDAIENAIGALVAGNPSTTLRSIQSHAQYVRNTFLNPIKDVCDDLAGTPCELAHAMVLDTKRALLVLLTAEIGDDVVDAIGTVVTLGADAAATSAEAYAVKEAVSRAATLAEADIANAVMSAANRYLDNFINSLINPFINGIIRDVEGAVDAYLPAFLLQRSRLVGRGQMVEDQVTGRLHISPSELDNCVESIGQSSIHLESAEQKLSAAIEEVFSHPAPNSPSVSDASVMRMALKGVMQTIKGDLVNGVENLVKNVIQHFTALLRDFMSAVDDLDEQARSAASKEHVLPGAPIAVLTAAGTGYAAAAAVAAASGRINAEEALSVRVEEVTAEDDTHTVTISAAGVSVSAEEASSTVSVDDVHLPAAAPTVTAGVATANHGGVETLGVKVAREGFPEIVGVPGGGGSGTERLSAHHVDGVRPHAEPVTAQPHSGPEHLDAKRRDTRGPGVARAERSPHGVHELREDGKGVHSPIADGSPEEGDALDQ